MSMNEAQETVHKTTVFVLVILGAVMIGIVVFFGFLSGGDAGMADVAQATATMVMFEVMPKTQLQMLAPVVLPTAVPVLGVGSMRVRTTDAMTMVFVPEGEFVMGDEDGNEFEMPVHQVYVDAFWMDKFEVTTAQFVRFLNATAVGVEDEQGLLLEEQNTIEYADGVWSVMRGFESHPVVGVSWFGANAYCVWVGGRLPTEAEWEKAARGTAGREYPWGNWDATNELMNMNVAMVGTMPVGSYPAGVSPYGVMDLAGNAWEWVQDWYDAGYYEYSPYPNPQGPQEGELKVARGGGGIDATMTLDVRSTVRWQLAPVEENPVVGFRCVQVP